VCARDTVTLLGGKVGGPATPEAVRVVVVAAPSIDLAGRVVDERGEPCADAGLWLHLAQPLGASSRLDLGDTLELRRWATTDGDGSFGLRGLPAADGVQLRVTCRGFRSQEIALAKGLGPWLELTLERDTSGRILIGGIVVDAADGGAIADARVNVGSVRTETDELGRFELAVDRARLVDPLFACKAGYAPSDAIDLSEFAPDPTGSLAPVQIELSGPALDIRGSVRHQDGRPATGWRVALADGTPSVEAAIRPAWIEDIAGQRESWQETDLDGRFALGGLRDRRYVLEAYDPRTLVYIESQPIAAGTSDVVMVVGEDALGAPLSGVVVSRGGAPLGGVEVTAHLRRQMRKGLWTIAGQSLRTDWDGRFQFGPLPRVNCGLSISGSGVVPTTVALEPNADALRVVVERLLPIRLEIEGSDVELLRALDSTGSPLPFFLAAGFSAGELDASQYRGQVVSVMERTTCIVAIQGDREVRRVAIPADASGIWTCKL